MEAVSYVCGRPQGGQTALMATGIARTPGGGMTDLQKQADKRKLAEIAKEAVAAGFPVSRERPQLPPRTSEPPPPRKRPLRQTWEKRQ